MTSERHAVASKIIATVDDLGTDRGGRQGRRRRPARLAPRDVRRSGIVAQARQAGAGHRKGPRRPGGPALKLPPHASLAAASISSQLRPTPANLPIAAIIDAQ
jgi:hypothetical protein